MQIKIVSQVKINITQEDIEDMVRAKVVAYDPKINVDSIEFTQRRNPTRIDVDVTAHYGDVANTEDEPETLTEVEDEEEVEQSTTETEENVPELKEEGSVEAEDDTQPRSIADIFGG